MNLVQVFNTLKAADREYGVFVFLLSYVLLCF